LHVFFFLGIKKIAQRNEAVLLSVTAVVN
jgi:hypothetical protein